MAASQASRSTETASRRLRIRKRIPYPNLMTPNIPTLPRPDRVPVSVIERLIPAISFATTAIGGAVGAMLLKNIYSRLRATEIAGLDSLYVALARMNAVVGGILSVAAFFGLIAVVVCLVRMRKKSSATAS